MYTIKDLYDLRTKYIQSTDSKKKESINLIFIDDEELVYKLNSINYKLHPTYPVLINVDGTEIYDIRDGFKVIIKSITGEGGRQVCVVKDYKKCKVYKLVAEAWSNRLLKNDETVHHVDENRLNNHYKNLQILNWKVHNKIHSKEKITDKIVSDNDVNSIVSAINTINTLIKEKDIFKRKKELKKIKSQAYKVIQEVTKLENKYFD